MMQKYRIVLATLIFFLLSSSASYSIECHATNPNCYLANNALVSLMSGETHKLSLEVSGMFPKASETSTFNRRRFSDAKIPRDFTISVENAGQPERSYLLILTGEYNKPSSIWTVWFNGETLVDEEHSDSAGTSEFGDGELDLERQTIFFDVTGLVEPGDNILTITGEEAPTTPYHLDGAFLLNFYPSQDEHQYWIYYGVEYLEHFGLEDSTYVQTFPNPDYITGSTATFYAGYQNREVDRDALYFNGNLLTDKKATYLLEGSHLTLKKFSVTKFLDASDQATFTIKKYQPDVGQDFIQYEDVSIYPSLAILDVKLPPRPKIIVLANSIDYERASDLFGFLSNRRMDVIHASADDFEQYKDEKFIIILGGPDAPEGVGEIVNGILSGSEADEIRGAGNRKQYVKTNPWGKRAGQVVWVLAGSNREQTKLAHQDNRQSVSQKVEEETKPEIIEEEEIDPCPPSEENPLTVIVEKTADVYICEVVYSQGEENWLIKLYNQGEDDVDIHRYQLIDRTDDYYRIMGDLGQLILPAESYFVLYGSTFNPQGSSSLLYLNAQVGELSLLDSQENLIHKVGWGS